MLINRRSHDNQRGRFIESAQVGSALTLPPACEAHALCGSAFSPVFLECALPLGSRLAFLGELIERNRSDQG
jgi:hypothetical protein